MSRIKEWIYENIVDNLFEGLKARNCYRRFMIFSFRGIRSLVDFEVNGAERMLKL